MRVISMISLMKMRRTFASFCCFPPPLGSCRWLDKSWYLRVCVLAVLAGILPSSFHHEGDKAYLCPT